MSPLLTSNIEAPLSLAVDWITDKLYLIQKSIGRIDVFAATPSGTTNRTALITTNIFTPTSMVIDPNSSYLFFADMGNVLENARLQGPKIERASMDGTVRQVIVKDKLLAPVALTIDTIKKRLYWADRKYDHIETCDYYGRRRFIVASGSRNLPHTVSLDLFESTLFYADHTKLGIMKLSRHTVTSEANITYHYKSLSNQKPRFVRVYHQNRQLLDRENPCAVNNGGCEHTCLLSHGDSGETMRCHRCNCRVGYQLRRDLKTCERIKQSLYVSQTSMIRAVGMDRDATGGESSEQRTPIIVPRVGASIRSIEVDCRNNVTFYFDPMRRAIFQNKMSQADSLDSIGETKILVPDNLAYVESMAFDWICKLLFLAISKLTRYIYGFLVKNLDIDSILYNLKKTHPKS
jgi:low density lipoprotein-related protein 2